MATYTASELLATTALGTSAGATIFTASNKTIIKQILVANVTATDRTFNLHIVPNGGAAGAGNKVFGDVTVQANTTTVVDLATVIDASDFIAGDASAASALNVHISGVEVT
jgi:ATP-dependent protease ClpP protease subunit